MRRRAIERLKEWKNARNRKPLIVNGARQVGKTWLLQEFGKTEFAHLAYINCDQSRDIRAVFSKAFVPEVVLQELSAIVGFRISEGDTLLVMDEVQETPEVISALKYFCELLPNLHVAVAGSLLGISLHSGVSFPVGKVDEIRLFPMSFSEFMDAVGETLCAEMLEAGNIESLASLHEKMSVLLRRYFFVGGMPAVVKEFVDSGDWGRVRAIQTQILRDYKRDFSKHAPTNDVPRINQIWEAVASQLAKENKKFVFGALRKGARASEYERAIQWLIDAGLVMKVTRVNTPEMPLKFYEEQNVFKLFLSDLGLLGAMAETDARNVVVDDSVFAEYKGAFTEQYVVQQLASLDKFNMYYHSTNDSRLEIDMLLQYEGRLVPIEIKSGKSVRSNSLSALLEKSENMHGVRYSMMPYKVQEKMTNYPLYMVEGCFAKRKID